MNPNRNKTWSNFLQNGGNPPISNTRYKNLESMNPNVKVVRSRQTQDIKNLNLWNLHFFDDKYLAQTELVFRTFDSFIIQISSIKNNFIEMNFCHRRTKYTHNHHSKSLYFILILIL
jgi:hypothetical protein